MYPPPLLERVKPEIHPSDCGADWRISICFFPSKEDKAKHRTLPDGASNRHYLPKLGEERLLTIIQILLRSFVRFDDGYKRLRLRY